MIINRLLTDKDRENYKPIIDKMWKLCPDMMSRKIPEANVQQAFVYDLVGELISTDKRVLSIGCFEDTAYESLLKRGWEIVGIDPDTDGNTLDSFYKSTTKDFDIVFSTSVLEHVQDDELFITQICDLLSPGGYAILTTDFRNDYVPGFPLPNTDVRFYTRYDLEVRFKSLLEKCGCFYVGETNWIGQPDFHYQGHNYSFATIVFRKDSNV